MCRIARDGHSPLDARPLASKHSSLARQVQPSTRRRLSRSPTSRSVPRMMMAHDSSHTPPSRLDDDIVDALRAALRAYLQDSRGPEPRCRRRCSRLPTEARARAILPEQLLVVLKDVWSSLPEVRSMTDAARADQSAAARRDDVHQGVL